MRRQEGGREGRKNRDPQKRERVQKLLLFEATVATLSFPPSHKRADEGHLSAVAPWPDNDHTHTHTPGHTAKSHDSEINQKKTQHPRD